MQGIFSGIRKGDNLYGTSGYQGTIPPCLKPLQAEQWVIFSLRTCTSGTWKCFL